MEPIVPTSHHALPIFICHTPSNTRIGNSCSAIPHGLGSITLFLFYFCARTTTGTLCSTTIGTRMTAFSGIVDSELRHQTSLVLIVQFLLVYCIKKRWRLSSFCFSSSFLCPSFFFNSDRASSKSTVGTGEESKVLFLNQPAPSALFSSCSERIACMLACTLHHNTTHQAVSCRALTLT